MKEKFTGKKKKFIIYAIALVVLLFVLFLIRSGRKNSATSLGTSNLSTALNPAIASKDIKREFTFPLRNSKGEEISSLKFNLETAEIRNEILVKGQRAKAVNGREFLIINLKITNQYSSSIQLNSKDYVRLAVNGNEGEWLAPDIHNDPVEVQADSTKYTRIGFPVNSTDKDFILRIGEINGNKETIKLEIR